MKSVRINDPVRATAEVVSCHAIQPRLGSPIPRWFNAILELDVSMPGAAPYRLQHPCNLPDANWPQPGGQMPVTVDRADPARIRVHWDQVSTPAEVAAAATIASFGESSIATPSPVRQSRITGIAKLLQGRKKIRATMQRF